MVANEHTNPNDKLIRMSVQNSTNILESAYEHVCLS